MKFGQTTRAQFHQYVLRTAYTLVDPKSVKNNVKSSLISIFLLFWDLRSNKLYVER